MRRIVGMLLSVTCFAGCGGGGGSAVGPGNPPPPPAPTQLAVTAQNASTVALVGMAGAEAATQLGIAVLDSLFDFSDTALTVGNVDCSAGTIGNSLIDNDSSGAISDGDAVEMDFMNCDLAVLGRPVSGRVTVDVTSLTILSDLSVIGNVTARFPQPLQFQVINGVGTSTSGTLALTFTASDDIENLLVETTPGGNLEVQIDDNGQTIIERFTDLRLTRTVDEVDDYILDFNLTADSGLAAGAFDCTTPASLEATLRFWPTTGMVECSGASNSAVRLVPESINVLATRVDPEGDGTFINTGTPPNGSGTWGDYIEGDLIATLIDLPEVDRSQIIPTISSTSFDISINDAIYGSAPGILYVSNDVAVVEVDTINLQTVRSIPVNGRPGPVALSDDGSTLWVGLQDVSDIVPIDTATMTTGTPVVLGVSRTSGADRFAGDIEVAPGTTDTLVVAMQGGSEVVAYGAGAALPNIVEDFFGPNRIEFNDATTLIGIETDTSGTHAARITLDANGLTLQQLLREYSGGSELLLGNEYAFTSSGRVIDVPNENIVGQIRFLAPTPFRDGFFIDRPAGTIYFYNEGSNILDFYDEQRLVPFGIYRLTSTGNLIRILDTNENQLLLVFDTGIHIVGKSLLTPTINPDPCRTDDLSGQLGPDFYVQTTCTFNDAVFDEARNLVYATLPASNGPIGNSVAVISPVTGILQSTIHVGTDPTRLSMSATGNLLYVVVSGSTTVAVVDLQTQLLTTPVKTKLSPPFMQPSVPEVVTASPVLDTEILISDGREIDIYSAGIPSANGTLRASQIEALFYRSDGQVAWAVELGQKLWEYAIDPLGLTDLREVRDAVQPRSLKIQNDLFYDIFGAVIDPVTLTVNGTCPVVTTGAVEPDLNGLYTYYWRQGFDSKLVACDLSNFSLSGDFDIPRIGGSVGEVRAFVSAGPNRLVMVAFDKMLFLDPAEIRAVP